MQTRHPTGKLLRQNNSPEKSGTPVEPGQPGSYGTDRVRVVNGQPETGPETAAEAATGAAGNKVDTGAAPSVGSSPSRQR